MQMLMAIVWGGR